MKKIQLVFIAILANFCTFFLVSGQYTYSDCPDALRRFTERDLIISTRYLRAYIKSPAGKTGSASPLGSLFNLIALAYFAKGATKKETYTTLNLKSREEMRCVASIINSEVSNLPDCIELQAATDFFANSQYQFTSDFKRVMTDVVVGRAINLDFSYPIDAKNDINSQVASQTGNRIKNVVGYSSLFNDSTELVSITALFLTATWEIEMQSTDEVTEFRVSPYKSEPQTFLYQDAVYLYGYSDILEAQVVQINFCCGIFYMWAILPDNPFTEDVVIDKMAQNIDWYYEILEKVESTRLDLYIPKYNRRTSVQSNNLFQKATGLKTIYNNKTIDLKGAIKGDCPAAANGGVQTTYLVTGFEGGSVPRGPQSRGPKKTLKFDSPHVWIIFRNGRVHLLGATASPVS